MSVKVTVKVEVRDVVSLTETGAKIVEAIVVAFEDPKPVVSVEQVRKGEPVVAIYEYDGESLNGFFSGYHLLLEEMRRRIRNDFEVTIDDVFDSEKDKSEVAV